MKTKKKQEISMAFITMTAAFVGCGITVLMYFINGTIPWGFTILSIILLIIGGVLNANETTKKENEKFKKQGIDPKLFIDAGKYIHGHTSIDEPFGGAYLYLKGDTIKIYRANGLKKEFLGNIDTSSITNIALEDETTISKRVGLKRMLALGIFAFAVQKKVKEEIVYIIIEWNQGAFKNETVFEFVGEKATIRANALRNKLIQLITN